MPKFPNLAAEMVRGGKSIEDVAKTLECSVNTAYRRLNGKSELSFESARRIRDNLFPTMSIEYLFAGKDDTQV